MDPRASGGGQHIAEYAIMCAVIPAWSLQPFASGSPTFVLEFLRLRQYAQLLLNDHQNLGNSGTAGCNA
jgi:hypothetical protein